MITVIFAPFSSRSTTPCADPLFTTSNGSHTRCEAVSPGNEASISILQIIFPSFSAKSVHPSVNLPLLSAPFRMLLQQPLKYCSICQPAFLLHPLLPSGKDSF